MFVAFAVLGSACSSHTNAAPSSPPHGTYRAALGPNVLMLRGNRWSLKSAFLVKSGVFRVSGSRMVFLHGNANNVAFRGSYCRGARDTYTWKLEARNLSFHVVGRACDVNMFAVLTVAGPWRPLR